MIKIGTTDIKGVMLGDTEISKVYLGTDVVYQNLPYDAEIEYLQGDGNAYIETGLYATNNTRFVCSYYQDSAYISGNIVLFGTRKLYPSYQRAFLVFPNADTGGEVKKLRFSFGSIDYQNLDMLNDQRVDIDFNKNVVNLNGSTVYTFRNATFTTATTVPLFGIHSAEDGYVKWFGTMRVYLFKMYENGVLVLDFIPVRVGTTGYMYDKVSKQLFSNAGTGDFILGPDVTS